MRTPQEYDQLADTILDRLLAVADEPDATPATRARALADAAQLALTLAQHSHPLAQLARLANTDKMGETEDGKDIDTGRSPRQSKRSPRPPTG